ncbi:hypothetical protein P5673_018135 [Acropora cervicornis]|uniref:Uncharacterized protein n=1 Tax=Acropora cervicornis TaxID=6130 RepID=A0AAD9QEJ3_ACRCE|nr:hypothetical protein P5673_018135 [Acropora cervicornis]
MQDSLPCWMPKMEITIDSSYATTFGNPWESIGDLRGTRRGGKAIADNILVDGCGASREEATRGHDKHLIALLERCRKSLQSEASTNRQTKLSKFPGNDKQLSELLTQAVGDYHSKM